MSAVLSECGRYRYALWRDVGELDGEGTVLFVMHNPSTANASEDDPTIRRCIRFARDWGFARLAVGNLYAWRATKPRDLLEADDPVGPENDEWLRRLVRGSELVVAAWGAQVNPATAAPTLRLHDRWRCLGVTAGGLPRHPLYVPAATRPQSYAAHPDMLAALGLV